MNEKSKIKVGDIADKILVEGVKYDFGDGPVWVVAVQTLPQGIWIHTQDCDALFDTKTGRLTALFSGSDAA